MTGFLSPPFGIFADPEAGTNRATRAGYCLAYHPDGRILATFRTYKDCKALAGEFARTARPWAIR